MVYLISKEHFGFSNTTITFNVQCLHLIASRWRVLISLEKLRKALANILLLDSWQQGKRKERFQTPFFSEKGKAVKLSWLSQACIFRNNVFFKGGMFAQLPHSFRLHSFILNSDYCLCGVLHVLPVSTGSPVFFKN